MLLKLQHSLAPSVLHILLSQKSPSETLNIHLYDWEVNTAEQSNYEQIHPVQAAYISVYFRWTLVFYLPVIVCFNRIAIFFSLLI